MTSTDLTRDQDTRDESTVASNEPTTLLLSKLPNEDPEIFVSLQGEGPTAGTPSVFVRLAVCNLSCSWCDSSYTWDWTKYDRAAETIRMTASEVIGRLKMVEVRNAVVTGGEPMLQQAGLVDVIAPLRAEGFRFEIETNGTISPQDSIARIVDQWNISPKLSNSGVEIRRRRIPEVLRAFAKLPNAFFKFVIENAEDLEEVESMREALGLDAQQVVLMPEGRDANIILSRSRWLADECTLRNFRFSTRLHILLWGDVRGT